VPTGRTPRPLVGLLLAWLLALALLPATAGAATIRDLLEEYQGLGEIDACSHTLKDLQDAKGAIGSDSSQYSPEFADALDAAIAARGSCPKDGGGTSGGGSSGGSGSSSGGGTATPSPGPTQTQEQQAPTATTAAAPPTPSPGPVAQPAPEVQQQDLIATSARPPIATETAPWTWGAIIGAILLVAALAWLLVSATGRIRWLQPVGHAMGEAGWRISARWAEFTDWLRLGGGR
jgi:cobalamin biosynthesis Mg chelatase CobN